MKALYLPTPAYTEKQAQTYAGWWKILEYQRQAIERAGFEVVMPRVPEEYLDRASSFSLISSYSLCASTMSVDGDVSLIVSTPSYGHHSFFLNYGVKKLIATVWNQADWFRDKQLQPEYAKFKETLSTLPINNVMNEAALNISNRVIANSYHVKKTHAEIIPESKISVALWGVDSQTFTPAGEEHEGFRILFFGGDMIRKGLIYAVEAMKEMCDDTQLWVIGCDPWEEAPEDARVFGVVPHTEVPALIRQCDVLVLPTLEDGMPLAVQEAMASGVVPITTPVAADAYEDYRSGFIVPYRDPGAIVKVLRMLRGSPELLRTMKRVARKKAEEQTWERFMDQFAGIVKEVCGEALLPG